MLVKDTVKTTTVTRRQDISQGTCPISPKTGVKFHSTPKNFNSRKFGVPSRLFERERLNTLFFFPEKLGDSVRSFGIQRVFHSGSTVHEKQRGAGRPLCLSQSHDSTEGRGEGGVEREGEGRYEGISGGRKKKKTDPASITVMDPYVTP